MTMFERQPNQFNFLSTAVTLRWSQSIIRHESCHTPVNFL